MIIYPEYQDSLGRINIKKGEIPFYIAIHTVMSNQSLHHHDFVEFTYVIDGEGYEIINGKKHELTQGIASFLLPHHIHQVHSHTSKQPVRKFCCMFDLQMLFGSSYDSQLASMLYKIGTELPSYTKLTGYANERIHLALQQLLEEYNNHSLPGRSSMIRAKVTEILLLFIRSVEQSYETGEQGKGEQQYDYPDKSTPFWKIFQHVHLHYNDKITLKKLSEEFQVSVPHISRTFRERTGRSFLEYLHHLRIESAATLLISTNMSITDIAIETGFESFRTFSRVFRELKAATPSEYRNQAMSSEEKTE